MPRSLLILVLTGLVWGADYQAPAGERPAAPRPGAVSILPGGRQLDPHGRQYATGAGPLGVAVSPKGRRIVTADSGTDGFSLTVLERGGHGRIRVRHVRPPAPGSKQAKNNDWLTVHRGVVFADDHNVFVGEGNSGRVRRIDITKKRGAGAKVYVLNHGDFRDSFTSALAYDRARRLLYVLDEANFRVVVIDGKNGRELASVEAGRLPFAMALSPDGRRLYVTNVGMFRYKQIPGTQPEQALETGIRFPAFGFPSPAARDGARRATGVGLLEVPGLGTPGNERANSLCVIDVEDARRPKVLRFIRTGKPIGPESHGGSSPAGVLATSDRVYVSNAHNDSVSVIDARSLKVVSEIPIRIPGLAGLRGILPSGLALHEATGWLLVAEAGINAVGVIDTKTDRVIGHIPAAWYPTSLVVYRDDVFVAGALGHGTGPNANRMIANRSRANRTGRGAITVFPIPAARDLKQLTRRALETNGFVPRKRARPANYPPEVKYVVLIVKESRTFDEIFGDILKTRGGDVNGAPMLARFGTTGSAGDAGGGFQRRFSLRAVNVTPNHHAMAGRWSISDNFYSDAVTSVEAHHWLAGVPPNPWTISSVLAAYGGNKDFRLPTSAPGRLLFAGSAGSVHPEEIPERGTLWDHLVRNGISFRNFGEGFELAGVRQDEGYEPTGARFLTNVAMPETLYRNTSRNYPGYNTNIPDQYRVDRFIEEVHETYRRPGKDLPRFLFIQLPNDDMALARPANGYPFTASYVADNDYALGRLVEYLSNSPWWKNMVVFVTEDEGQGGVDHVDTHRVPLIAFGPNIRRHYVSHRNVSFPGLFKTIFGILGIEPLNLFDAAATDLRDLFTTKPDFTPYGVLAPNKELFVPANAKPAQPTG